MTVDFKPGMSVRVQKPVDVEKDPSWVDNMDYLDGSVIVLDKQNDHGEWYTKGGYWALGEQWLTAVEQDRFSTDIKIRETQTSAMVESLLMWDILRTIPTGKIGTRGISVKNTILKAIFDSARRNGCPLCEHFHFSLSENTHDCPIGYCVTIIENRKKYVPCTLLSYGKWETEMDDENIHNQNHAEAFFNELCEISTEHVIELYKRECKMLSHIDVSPKTLFGDDYEETKKVYYVYGDWWWYYNDKEWKQGEDDHTTTLIKHGTEVTIEKDTGNAGYIAKYEDDGDSYVVYSVRMDMLVEEEPTSKPMSNGTVMYVNDDYSYYGEWINNLSHLRQLKRGTEVTVKSMIDDTHYEIGTVDGRYSHVRPDMLSEEPPVKIIRDQVWDEDMLEKVDNTPVIVDEHLILIREMPASEKDPTFQPFELDMRMKVSINTREESEVFYAVLNYSPFSSKGNYVWSLCNKLYKERGISKHLGTVMNFYEAWKERHHERG